MAKQSNGQIINIKDLLPFIRLARRNLFILIGLPLLFGAVAAFYSYRLPDIYGASCQILLKSPETYDYQEKIYRSLGYYETYGDISNQIRVLKSRNLVSRALDKLNFDVSYYIKGKVRTTPQFENMPFVVEVQNPIPSLYGQEIHLRILDADNFKIIYFKGKDRIEKTFKFDKQEIAPDFVLRVSKRGEWKQATVDSNKEVDYMFVLHRRSDLIRRYMSTLSIANLEYTTILQIEVRDELGQRARTFLATLAEEYIDYTLQSKIDVNENTVTFINKQLDEVIGILNSIEDTLEYFKSQNQILNLNREESNYFSKLVTYDSERRELKIRLKSLGALEEYVMNINTEDEKLLPSSFYVYGDDDFLSSTIRDVYNLQMQRNSILVNATPNSPDVRQIDEQLRLLKSNLLVYIQNSKGAVQERIGSLSDEISEYEGIIKTIPQTQRDMLNIQRKLQVNEKLYIHLLEMRANTIIARAGIVPETKIIENARSMGVVGPDKQKQVILLMGAGFILALLITFIRAIFFHKITEVNELAELTELSVLGHVFESDTLDPQAYVIPKEEIKSPVMESLRSIRTSLQYFTSQGASQVILVTSVTMGEGKTFCSVNLANIFARANKKVLVIELDLHKPRVHTAFQMETDRGLSTYLSKHTTYEELIQSTPYENLDVALCGPVPPNASELMLSERLAELISKARENYDYVIIDTPPIGMISDAFVAMKLSDVNIVVFNAKGTRKQEVNFVEEVIEKNNISHVGIVLNNVKQRKWRKYYGRYGSYGYGSSYGYGYGYGYGINDESV